MNSTYAQKSSTIQKAADTKAASVLDSSAQSDALQRKADMANNAAQRAEAPRPNNTGMPDNLKAGIESLSGFSMDDVRVHYNSSKPATVQALAYTQGTDIHVAPGQEKCLPHEAWHVAQQMAGRVSPTTNINGMPVNDNAGLEHEADVMGEKAVQCKSIENHSQIINSAPTTALQRKCFLVTRNLAMGASKSSSHPGSYHAGQGSHLSSDGSAPFLVGSSSGGIASSVASNASSGGSTEGGSKTATSVKFNNGQPNPPTAMHYLTNLNRNAVPLSENQQNLEAGNSPNNSVFNLGFFHAHFIFTNTYNLPYGINADHHAMGDNIGYGGNLYYEDDISDYDLREQISVDNPDQGPLEDGIVYDSDVKTAMWMLCPNQNFGTYDLTNNNCQHWAAAVKKLSKEISNNRIHH